MPSTPHAPSRLAGLRILHVTDSMDWELGGGTARRTYDVAQEMARRGSTVQILSLSTDQPRERRPLASNIQHTTIRTPFQRFMFPCGGRRIIRDLVDEAEVVHLMGHWSLLNAVVAGIARRSAKPYVVTPAGALKPWGRSLRLKAVYNLLWGRRVIRGAAGHIAVVAEELVDFAPFGVAANDVQLIPNAIAGRKDASRSGSGLSSAQTGNTSHREFLLFLGRLHSIKGPDLLLDAFLSVADELDYDLVIAGPDNGLRPSLEAKARASGLANRISFTGFVDGSGKEELVRNSAAMVVPSRREAMSMVVLEAAAVGKAVLATSECGLERLFSNTNAGELVPATVEGIAKGLIDLTAHDLRAIGSRLQEAAIEMFGWDTIAHDYELLYQQVLSGPRGKGT